MAKPKKEIDKDLMYKKLMPSGGRDFSDATSSSGAFKKETEPDFDSSASPRHGLSPRELKLSSKTVQTILVNAMEAPVFEKLDSVLARFKCCKCDRCKKEIIAQALNKLPPKYVVLVESQPVPEPDTQESAQILSAMIQAVLSVRANPRH